MKKYSLPSSEELDTLIFDISPYFSDMMDTSDQENIRGEIKEFLLKYISLNELEKQPKHSVSSNP